MGYSKKLLTVALPKPALDGPVSVELALSSRKSVRKYTAESLSLAEISQVLWAAQGITHDTSYRTAPSAGATYPLEVFLICGRVDGLAGGVYRYSPQGHELSVVDNGDKWPDLWSTVLANREVKESAAVVAFAAVYERTTGKYGERAERYVHMEVGHVVQNVYLQAGAMGLATVVMGSFNDDEVSRLLGCLQSERPMVLMPLGRPGIE